MSAFRDDVISGLSAQPKSIPSKHLYDAEGSRLFEAITKLPEYYPTRTETALLARVAPEWAETVPKDATLVEFGSGSSTKTRLLLDAAPQLAGYAPVDISGSALEGAAAALRAFYSRLAISPLQGDFTRPATLAGALAEPLAGFFPGSTIGNFDPAGARAFLAEARVLLGAGSRFLVGLDLVKSPAVLVAAYDDAQGVTAAFNLNLLARVNRELEGDAPLDAFAHEARWNANAGRMEMHLVARRPVRFKAAGRAFDLAESETIHTENSYKFTVEGFTRLAERAGWTIDRRWTADPPFALVLLRDGG